MSSDLQRAWDALPAAIKAHPGIKALYRAASAPAPAPAEPEEQKFDRMGWINEAMRLALHYREASTAAANAPYLALLDHLRTAGMHWRAFTFLRDKEAKETAAPAPAEPVATLGTDGHPRHIRHVWGVQELRLYGPPIPLYTAAPAAPAGWQLVPVEPTEAMEIAGALAHEQSSAHDKIGPIADAWAAMLAAAPGAQGDAS